MLVLIYQNDIQTLRAVHQAERGDGGGERAEVHAGGAAAEEDEEAAAVLADEQAVRVRVEGAEQGTAEHVHQHRPRQTFV